MTSSTQAQHPIIAPEAVADVSTQPTSQSFSGSYYPPSSSAPSQHNQPQTYSRTEPLPVIPDEEEPIAQQTMSAVAELYPSHVSPRIRRRYDTVPQEEVTPPVINRASKPAVANNNTTDSSSFSPRPTSHKPIVDYSRKPSLDSSASQPSDYVGSPASQQSPPLDRRRSEHHDSTSSPQKADRTSKPVRRPPPAPPVTRPDVLHVTSAASQSEQTFSSSGDNLDKKPTDYNDQSHYHDRHVSTHGEQQLQYEERPSRHTTASPQQYEERPSRHSTASPHYEEERSTRHTTASPHYEDANLRQPEAGIRGRYPTPGGGHEGTGVEGRRFRQMQPVPHQYYMEHAGGRPTELSREGRGSDPNLLRDRASSGRSFASLSSNDSQDDKQMPIKIPGRRHLSSGTPTSDPPTPVSSMSLREAARLMPQGLVNPSYRVATMAVDVMPNQPPVGSAQSQSTPQSRVSAQGHVRPTPSRRKGGLPGHVRKGIVQGVWSLYILPVAVGAGALGCSAMVVKLAITWPPTE